MQSSLKDIPLPTEETFMKLLIGKTNDFIRRLRWKVFHAEKSEKKKVIKDKNTGINVTNEVLTSRSHCSSLLT